MKIELRDIKCGYGKKIILKDVDLQFEKGKFSCLMGKNGAGKTTLFKTALGILPQLSGSIHINNCPIESLSIKDMASLISYVPQAHGTPFAFSVLEVVLMGQHVHSKSLFTIPNKKNRAIAMECLERLGIQDFAQRCFSKLSGGEKQMVLIARALAQQPHFIAMDEPTSNLDLGNQIKVMKTAEHLRDQGYGIIMNTHSPEQALQYADRVVMLKDGHVLANGNPRKMMHADLISEIYGTPVELITAHTKSGEARQLCMVV